MCTHVPTTNIVQLALYHTCLIAWSSLYYQSILKEISPEDSLEGLMLKLKLQYFGHLMRGTDSLQKTLMLGKIEGRRRRGQQRMLEVDTMSEADVQEHIQNVQDIVNEYYDLVVK